MLYRNFIRKLLETLEQFFTWVSILRQTTQMYKAICLISYFWAFLHSHGISQVWCFQKPTYEKETTDVFVSILKMYTEIALIFFILYHSFICIHDMQTM